jgi:hypothetical protein
MEIIRKASIISLKKFGVRTNIISRKFRITSSDYHESSGAAWSNQSATSPPCFRADLGCSCGRGTLLLGQEHRESFGAGDVVRLEEGDLHGFENSEGVPFIYLSVAALPLNFRQAYAKEWANNLHLRE